MAHDVAVRHGGNQRGLTFGVFQQIIHQIRIAHHRPHIAQHFKQHPRRTPCFALAAQGFQSLPSVCAQQTAHDFAVGIRGIVIGDFADSLGMGHECVPCGWCSCGGFYCCCAVETVWASLQRAFPFQAAF